MAVNLSPLGGVGAQFFDSNGNPLSGGMIYTYAAGTNTPAATFTTSAGSIQHSNPIILDAAGRVPTGEIWLTDGVSYKFVIQTSAAVLVGTYDNIVGINSNFVNFTNQQEIQTATAGQTVFDLVDVEYSPGTNSITVFVDGVNQYGPGAQYAYVETDSNTVTFVSGLHEGASVKFTTSQLNSSSGVDASQVSYVPPFTDSVATNVEDKLAQTVSIMDFGADPSGVSDSTSAIQAALASMETTGGVLNFPPGTYKVTSPIAQAFDDGVNVQIVGYGAKIDGTSVTGTVAGDTRLLLLGGSTSPVNVKPFANSALGSSVTRDDTVITSAGTFGVQPNDILLITSTDLWNPTRSYYYKGEMVEVQDVSGTTITCSNGLYDSYTASTTTIYKLPMPYVSVEGLEIEMDANQIGLSIQYSRNATIRNATVHGARYNGIETFYCFGGLVDNCFVYDAWYSGTGASYGVTVASNQNFSVTNCTLTQARHCITSGGYEPVRVLNYSNNHCTSHPLETTNVAIDVHGNAEFVIIANNYAEGIICGGINASILGNTVTNNRSNATGINIYQEINSVYYNINDNYITSRDSLASAIWISAVEDNLTINRLNISCNTVISIAAGLLIRPRNAAVTGSTVISCFITGNIVISDSGNAFVLDHGVGSDITVNRLSTSNNNFSTSTGGLAFYIINTATIDMHTSTGDSYIAGLAGGTSIICYFAGTDIKLSNAYFDGRLNGGGALLGGRINYNNTGNIQVNNCTFKNLVWRASLLSASATYMENGCIDETSSNVIINTVNAKIITTYDSAGNAVASRTAAPTINTWGVGDVVWNSTPVVGQPKGWMCTVAGTPGTWVSMGNL